MRNLPFLERNVRRTKVYGSRLLRSVAYRPLRHNCCFYHIPKSGGTSLTEALQAVVPFNLHIGEVSANTTRRAAAIIHSGKDDEVAFTDDGVKAAEVFALREGMQLSFMANQVGLVHGHMLFSEKADEHFGTNYKYVTMLRDPIARVISNYRDARSAGYVTEDFSRYLHTLIGRNHAMQSLRYLSGRSHVHPGEEADALARAKTVIQKFAVVGFIEALDDFIVRFEDVFGARLSIGHYNAGKKAAPAISPADRKLLEAACAVDYELHAFARSMIDGQKTAPLAEAFRH